MLIVVVLFATVVLRAALVTTFVYFMLPAKAACPRCGAQLALIKHSLLRVLCLRSSTAGASIAGGVASCGFSRA